MATPLAHRNVEADIAGPSENNSLSGAVASRPSAITSRLTNVLSASYADLEIRDALETLDARGIQNNQDTRRQLRLDVQKEIVQCNGEIVQDFGTVAEQLKRVGNAINSLNTLCATMRSLIKSADDETASVLEEAGSLISQSAQVQVKQNVLETFKEHFVISEDDITTLTYTGEPVNDEFFRVLTRVKNLHRDSRVLLGTENQTLGLEILEKSSRQLNAAYQKLYRWVQRDFKSLDLENPQISSSIRRSLRVLAERPALFQNCLDYFVEAREQVLSDTFYNALTGSSDADDMSHAKPIDFHAHDPLRYVGDMLAWTHSATVSEREALEVLFISEGDEIARTIQAGVESEPWNKPEGEEVVFDGRRVLSQLVDRNLTGIGRVLRQRTEQVIQSHEDATLAYKLANLVGFYKHTFSKLLGPESAFLTVLSSLEESALRQFRANMKDRIAASQLEMMSVPADLSRPEFLEEVLETLKILMQSYDSSLSAIEGRENGFRDILGEALDPFLSSCEKLAQSLRGPAKHIFTINCLLSAKAALESFTFTKKRRLEIETMLEVHLARLLEYQHEYLLRASGLKPLVVSLAELSDSQEDLLALPSLESFRPEPLTASSQQLDDFLPSALMDAKENIHTLQSKELAQRITEDAADRFCDDFQLVEDRILASDALRRSEETSDGEEESVQYLRDLFPRTSGEIRVLLS